MSETYPDSPDDVDGQDDHKDDIFPDDEIVEVDDHSDDEDNDDMTDER